MGSANGRLDLLASQVYFYRIGRIPIGWEEKEVDGLGTFSSKVMIRLNLCIVDAITTGAGTGVYVVRFLLCALQSFIDVKSQSI